MTREKGRYLALGLVMFGLFSAAVRPTLAADSATVTVNPVGRLGPRGSATIRITLSCTGEALPFLVEVSAGLLQFRPGDSSYASVATVFLTADGTSQALNLVFETDTPGYYRSGDAILGVTVYKRDSLGATIIGTGNFAVTLTHSRR